MVFKRYIKKHGKKLGPYYYQNIRGKDGKIRSVYIGPDYKKYKKKRFVNAVILLSIILIAAVFGFYYLFYNKDFTVVPSLAVEKKSELFEVDQIIIKVLLKEDEFFARQIKITNTDNQVLDFSLNIHVLNEIVDIQEREFSLKPGQVKTVVLNFTTSQKDKNIQYTPGIYTGKLAVKAGNDERIIPIIIEIESKKIFFDMNLLTLSTERIVKKGEEINFEVRIFNLEYVQSANVDMAYYVKDFDGNNIITQSESVIVKNQASFSKTIEIPKNANPGNYVFAAVAKYGSSVGTATYLFDIIEEPKRAEEVIESRGIFNVCKNDVYCWSLLFFIIIILILVVIFTYFTIGTWLFFKLTSATQAKAAKKAKVKVTKKKVMITRASLVVIGMAIFLGILYLLFPREFTSGTKFLVTQRPLYYLIAIIISGVIGSIVYVIKNKYARKRVIRARQEKERIRQIEEQKRKAEESERQQEIELRRDELKQKKESERARLLEEQKIKQEEEKEGREREKARQERLRQLEEQKKKEQQEYEKKRKEALEKEGLRQQEEAKKLKRLKEIEQELAREKLENNDLIAEKERVIKEIKELNKKKIETENNWNDKIKALEQAAKKISEYEQKIAKIKDEHEIKLKSIENKRQEFVSKLKGQKALFDREMQEYEQKEVKEVEKKAEGLSKKDKATFEKLKLLEIKSNIGIKLKEFKKRQSEELNKYQAEYSKEKEKEKTLVEDAVKDIEKRLNIAEIKEYAANAKKVEEEKKEALEKFEDDIGRTQERLDDLEQEIQQVKALITEKQEQIAKVRAELRKLRPGIIDRMMSLWRERAVEKEKKRLIVIKAEEHELEKQEKAQKESEFLYKKINDFKVILEEVNKYVRNNKKDEALKSYAELKMVYDRIAHSEGLTVDAKKFLYEKITDAYHRIKEMHTKDTKEEKESD